MVTCNAKVLNVQTDKHTECTCAIKAIWMPDQEHQHSPDTRDQGYWAYFKELLLPKQRQSNADLLYFYPLTFKG